MENLDEIIEEIQCPSCKETSDFEFVGIQENYPLIKDILLCQGT